jgi:hypothetical protein
MIKEMKIWMMSPKWKNSSINQSPLILSWRIKMLRRKKRMRVYTMRDLMTANNIRFRDQIISQCCPLQTLRKSHQ